MTRGWRAKIGGGYFGAETLLGYVAATMFSEDGLKYLVWTTPISWCSFEHVWGGQEQNSVSTGIVSSLINITGSVATTTATSTGSVASKISAINTNIVLADSLSGGPLLNLYGEVVGLKVSSTISDKINFLPSNILKQEVANYASVQ